MTRRRIPFGAALFWIFFVPYVVGVVIFLAAGLAPSVVKEFGGLHAWLHEYGDDALRADGEVALVFEGLDHDGAHRVVIRDTGERTVVSAAGVKASGPRAVVRFVAPPAGSYHLTLPDHAELEGEIRFADDGARSLSMRVHGTHAHFERVGTAGWPEVAHRVADSAHRADHGGRVTLESLFSVLNLGLGLLLVFRRPRDRTALLLAVGMVGTAVTFNHQSHATVRDYIIGDWWLPHDLCHILSGVAYLYAVVVFPDGRLLPSDTRPRWLLRAGYGLATLVLAVNVLERTSEGHPGQAFFTVLFGLLIPVVGVASQTYRLRHSTDAVVRQQSRLLRLALLPLLVGGVIYFVLTRVSDAAWVEDVGPTVFPALFALVPIALVMGILRYRLWDIDVLVSRTLLSVGLAAFIGSVYVIVVVGLGHGLGPGGSAGLKIVATAIAALAFEPVRERLARFANRLVYGERATPYDVVSEFSDRLAGAVSVEEILPRIAETTVKGVGAIAGQVTAYLAGGGSQTVEWPPGHGTTPTLVMPVTYDGQPIGEIAVTTAHNERLRPREEALLAALAAQVGLAVNNARLTIELKARLTEISAQAAELHASRQRIVSARQGQRQRVVQLIHDRVEVRLQHASGLLDGLDRLLTSDPARAIEVGDALLVECREALEALRDLAHGIFPAILADQGVVIALEAYVMQAHLPVDVRIDATDPITRHDPQAEATVYFCVIQALANAGAYAPESSVVVRIDAEAGRLSFSVTDDGPGTDPERLLGGADVRDMRDRVEAIGGDFDAVSTRGLGTVVAGSVPVVVLVLS